MDHIHPNARTTPAVRAEIVRSSESSGVLATCCGVSTETIRKVAQAQRLGLPGPFVVVPAPAVARHR
jgi:transposase-like protein